MVYPGSAVFTPSPFLGATVNPSPMIHAGVAAVFNPSLLPEAMVNPPPTAPPMEYTDGSAVFAPPPVHPVTPATEKGKREGEKKEGRKEDQGQGQGWRDTMYCEEEIRYWEFTALENTTYYNDPYF